MLKLTHQDSVVIVCLARPLDWTILSSKQRTTQGANYTEIELRAENWLLKQRTTQETEIPNCKFQLDLNKLEFKLHQSMKLKPRSEHEMEMKTEKNYESSQLEIETII